MLGTCFRWAFKGHATNFLTSCSFVSCQCTFLYFFSHSYQTYMFRLCNSNHQRKFKAKKQLHLKKKPCNSLFPPRRLRHHSTLKAYDFQVRLLSLRQVDSIINNDIKINAPTWFSKWTVCLGFATPKKWLHNHGDNTSLVQLRRCETGMMLKTNTYLRIRINNNDNRKKNNMMINLCL